MKKIYALFIPAFLFLGLLSCKQQKEYDVIIRDVTMFDGERVIKHANVYVKNGLVDEIDSCADQLKGACKQLVDGKNKTLIPGLINAHAHPQSRKDLKDAAGAGILTMLDLLRVEEDSIPVFKALGKEATYSYYYTSGYGVDMPNAVIKSYIKKENPLAPLSKKAVEQFIAARIEKKVDFIKIFQDSRLPEKFSDTLFDHIIGVVHANKLKALVHAETLRDADYAFRHGADVIAHGWVDSLITEKRILAWKQRAFYVMPTLLVHVRVKEALRPLSYTLQVQEMIQEIGKLHKAGIPILAGSDPPADGLNFTTDFYEELSLYAKAGMSTLDVLKTATVNPSTAFNLKEKGRIGKDLPADLVLVGGDLFSDISKLQQVEAVWKSGIRIK